MPDNVIVYESEGHRMFDQWLWHGGGWHWVLIAVVVLLLCCWIFGDRGK